MSTTDQHWRFTPLLLAVLLAGFVGIVMWTLQNYQGLSGSLVQTEIINGQSVRYGSVLHGEIVSLPSGTAGIFTCPSSEPTSGSWTQVSALQANDLSIYEYVSGYPEKNREQPDRWNGRTFGYAGQSDTLTAFMAGRTYYVKASNTINFSCSTNTPASSAASSLLIPTLPDTPKFLTGAAGVMDYNHDREISLFEAVPVIARARGAIDAVNDGQQSYFDPELDINRSGILTGIDALLLLNAYNAKGSDPSGAVVAYIPLEEGFGETVMSKGLGGEITLSSTGILDWSKRTTLTGSLYAGVFNGTSTSLMAPDSTLANYSSDNAFSVSVWAKPDTTATMSIVSKTAYQNNDNALLQGWQLNYSDQKYEFVMYTSSTQILRVTTTSQFAPGKMHHVFVSFQGQNATSVKIFVDGIEQGKTILSDDVLGGSASNSGKLTIGAMDLDGAQTSRFQGLLDDIMILNGVQSPQIAFPNYPIRCGDGMCIGDETSYCFTDCAVSTCGDNFCGPNESISSCAADCPLAGTCTDGDIGPDLNVRGAISRTGGSGLPLMAFDYCMGSTVIEYQCPVPDGAYLTQSAFCPNGCSHGVCR